jgi:hypothetical protein
MRRFINRWPRERVEDAGAPGQRALTPALKVAAGTRDSREAD